MKKLRTQTAIDGIGLEILKNGLETIADEMSIILVKSAYSPIVRDVMDFATSISDANGQPIAQGLTQPFHLGSFNDVLAHLREHYAGRIAEGDVFIGNDPYTTNAQHLPDIFVIKPVFFRSALLGWSATFAHHVDIGGLVPGSNALGATEIFQEGLRLPLLKLVDSGRLNEAVLDILRLNVRMPAFVLGDVRAQMAACLVGERGLIAIAERHGPAEAERAFRALHRYAERLTRAEIKKIPDGDYTFTDHIDGLGDQPEPIRLQVTLSIRDDRIAVDWKGTSSQVAGGINTHMPFTRSCCLAAIRSVISPEIPNCLGFARPISVTAPRGSVVNATFPAPCGARGITGFRMLDCLFGALAKALPDRVPADSFGGNSLITFGFEGAGNTEVFVETVMGNSGGASWHDGQEGIPHIGANLSNVPVEQIEAQYPLRIRHYGFVPDSGGPGAYRGGLAIEREYEVCAARAVLTLRTDKKHFPPHGLAGGGTGAPSVNKAITRTGEKDLPVLPTEPIPFAQGDVFRHAIPGGGGYGDPVRRDAISVLEDVLDGKVSREHARSAYGVVLTATALEKDLRIDAPATVSLRKQIVKGRRTRQGGAFDEQ
jgi:N-methylhydantoinase B